MSDNVSSVVESSYQIERVKFSGGNNQSAGFTNVNFADLDISGIKFPIGSIEFGLIHCQIGQEADFLNWMVKYGAQVGNTKIVFSQKVKNCGMINYFWREISNTDIGWEASNYNFAIFEFRLDRISQVSGTEPLKTLTDYLASLNAKLH